MSRVALFFILTFYSYLIAQLDPNPERFYPSKIGRELSIEQFIEWDKKNSFSINSVLFVGSSSVRLWPTNQYFNYNIINRGFGGAHLSDIIHYFDLIVSKYKPKVILLYAGDNDIAAKKTPKRFLVDYQKFVKLVNDNIPGCSIIFIPIKPSPARWKYWNNMREANSLVNQYIKKFSNQYYVDIVGPMLNDRGRPISEFFISDSLHLSFEGYNLWSEIVHSLLDEVIDESIKR
jgi:lysophospholipase L1-like esterase